MEPSGDSSGSGDSAGSDGTQAGPGIATVVDEFGAERFAAGIEVDPRGGSDPTDGELPDLMPDLEAVVELAVGAGEVDTGDCGVGTSSVSSDFVRPEAPEGRSYLLVAVDDHGYPPDIVALVMGVLRDRLLQYASGPDCWARVLTADEVEEAHEAQGAFWEAVLETIEES